MEFQMEFRMDGEWQVSLPTLGELCEAIAEGRVAYKERYGYVELSALEARRLAREDRVLGKGVIPAASLSTQDTSHSGSFA